MRKPRASPRCIGPAGGRVPQPHPPEVLVPIEPNVSKLNLSSLMRSAEGLTQWRPMLLSFLTLVGAGLLFMLSGVMAGKMGNSFGSVLAMVMSLVALALMAAGFSGSGVMLMDKAKRIPVRSMTDAVIFGFLCLPRFIGFALVLLVIAIAMALVAALVYLLCKIPGVGPLLLFVAHPVMVLGAAFIATAVMWVAFPMFTPAVLDGRGFKEALAVVYESARTRLFQVVLMLVALYVIAAIIMGVVMGGLFAGYGFMTALAAAVMSEQMASGFGMMGQVMGFGRGYGMGHGGDSGQVYALMLASGVIFSVVFSLLMQVLIMGINLVYLSVTEGLDLTKSQAALDAGLEQARRKAKEAQERAKEAAERARQARPVPATVPATAATNEPAPAPAVVAPTVPDTAGCPKCGTPVAADDLFCGSCGHKLQ